MNVCERLQGYRKVQLKLLNSLIAVAYSALKFDKVNDYNHYGAAVRRKNFGGG